MGDKFIAGTQYNDLVGTAAFDGHEHPPVYELAERTSMPEKGYIPVGFELFRFDPDEDGNIPFQLIAVKCREAGDKIDDVIQYAKNTSELRVYRFDGTLKSAEFAAIFKRIDIKVIHKELHGANVVAYHSSEA